MTNVLLRTLRRTKEPLRLYWFVRDDFKLNFGDEITQYIIWKLFGFHSRWTPIDSCDMIGAGSIIEFVNANSKGHKIHVWGSGFIRPGEKITETDLIFHAVRGKYSQERVSNSSIKAIGDPGILVNLVFPPAKEKHNKIGLIAHYKDSDSPTIRQLYDNDDFVIINPLDPVEKVLYQITECRLILSSSLHGLIVADSYSIPNIHVPLSDKIDGGTYKFEDYYSSINKQYTFLEPSHINDLKSLENVIRDYKPVNNLKQMQKELIKAFPFYRANLLSRLTVFFWRQ